ncbi:MAG: hypothetical protein RR293_06670 [Bacteroidales bacterium]
MAEKIETNLISIPSQVSGVNIEIAVPAIIKEVKVDSNNYVYVAQPIPPYGINDIWLKSNGDILVCKAERGFGDYNRADWIKIGNYTVPSALEDYVQNAVYTQKIDELQTQIDGKIESFFYDYDPMDTNAPANEWLNAVEKEKHRNDTFTNNVSGYSWRWAKNGSGYTWVRIDDPNAVEALKIAGNAKDTADGKRRIFTTTPTPPYDAGDLWPQGIDGDIMTCQTSRLIGNYVASDWVKASKYTDDTAAIIARQEAASAKKYAKDNVVAINTQLDQKAESWYQDTDPSTAWTTEDEKKKHIADIWKNTNSTTAINGVRARQTAIWSGETWTVDETIPDAVFDKIDSKADIFVSKPTSYRINDIWFVENDIVIPPYKVGDMLVSNTTSSQYNADHWSKKIRYTDDSATEYMRNALSPAIEGSTQIDGGLLLSNFMGVKDAPGNIIAGMIGYLPSGEADFPVLFAGAENMDKVNNAKFRVYQKSGDVIVGTRNENFMKLLCEKDIAKIEFYGNNEIGENPYVMSISSDNINDLSQIAAQERVLSGIRHQSTTPSSYKSTLNIGPNTVRGEDEITILENIDVNEKDKLTIPFIGFRILCGETEKPQNISVNERISIHISLIFHNIVTGEDHTIYKLLDDEGTLPDSTISYYSIAKINNNLKIDIEKGRWNFKIRTTIGINSQSTNMVAIPYMISFLCTPYIVNYKKRFEYHPNAIILQHDANNMFAMVANGNNTIVRAKSGYYGLNITNKGIQIRLGQGAWHDIGKDSNGFLKVGEPTDVYDG